MRGGTESLFLPEGGILIPFLPFKSVLELARCNVRIRDRSLFTMWLRVQGLVSHPGSLPCAISDLSSSVAQLLSARFLIGDIGVIGGCTDKLPSVESPGFCSQTVQVQIPPPMYATWSELLSLFET